MEQGTNPKADSLNYMQKRGSLNNGQFKGLLRIDMKLPFKNPSCIGRYFVLWSNYSGIFLYVAWKMD